MYTLTLVAALLFACDDFGAAQQADTIEAYEAYLADNPDGTYSLQARVRLEELHLEKAREAGTLEAWDAFLAKFPDGNLKERAVEERESSLWTHAMAHPTAKGWGLYASEYPSKDRKRAAFAKRAAKAMAFFEENIELSKVTTRKVNLAEDPEGPLNGTAFTVTAKNRGEDTIRTLWFQIDYLAEDGRVLDSDKWPLVATYAEYPVPVEEEKTVPMEPGASREWEWWTGDLPEGFSGRVNVWATAVKTLDTEAEAGEPGE